jgi:hypothetical protein
MLSFVNSFRKISNRNIGFDVISFLRRRNVKYDLFLRACFIPSKTILTATFNKLNIYESKRKISFQVTKQLFADESQLKSIESIIDDMNNLLKKEFNTDQVYVEDTSSCGQSFRIVIKSNLFKGKSRVDQHRYEFVPTLFFGYYLY